MKRHILFLLILASFGQTAFGKTLELDANNRNASVSVSNQHMNLTIEKGELKDYTAGNPRIFDLTVGGCEIRFETTLYNGKQVLFVITVNNLVKSETTIFDLKRIDVDKKNLTFAAENSVPISISCNPVFKSINDKYLISLGLSDDVPQSFKVKSDAEVYVQSQESEKKSISDATLAIYIGIGVVALFFLSVASLVVGCAIHRSRKNKKAALLEEQLAAKHSDEQAKREEEEKAAAKLKEEKAAAKLKEEERIAEKSAVEKSITDKIDAEQRAAKKASRAKLKAQKEISAEEKDSDRTSKMVNSKSDRKKDSKIENGTLKAQLNENPINTGGEGFVPAHLYSDVSKKT